MPRGPNTPPPPFKLKMRVRMTPAGSSAFFGERFGTVVGASRDKLAVRVLRDSHKTAGTWAPHYWEPMPEDPK
jgi:hypothetical protein